MMLPRFSIRTLLAALTAFAILALFAGRATDGRAWALGLTVGALSIPLALAFHAVFFGIGMWFARLQRPGAIVARTSRGGYERSHHEDEKDASDVSTEAPAVSP